MDEEITDKELRAMKERIAATTSGPWESFVEGRDHLSGSNFIRTGDDDIELSGASIADQDFIAKARQDMPRLIEALEGRRRRDGVVGRR